MSREKFLKKTKEMIKKGTEDEIEKVFLRFKENILVPELY